MSLTISFPGTEQTTLAEVGGKGFSLIRMVEAGVPVPPGAVLTTEIFSPWFDEIKASATWTALADATPDKWPTLCNELKGLCRFYNNSYSLSPTHKRRELIIFDALHLDVQCLKIFRLCLCHWNQGTFVC